MDNNTYLNFNEAVEVLSTTPSTLYKWLQTGKVPGHKLGRQWRFRREELVNLVDGKDLQIQASLRRLDQFFRQRIKNNKEKKMNPADIGSLAENLLWDAANSNAQKIHIQPNRDKYSLSYRHGKSFEPITEIDKEVFTALTNYWTQISNATTRDNKRRFFINRDLEDSKECLQVLYQQLKTIQGERVTLKLLQTNRNHISLKSAVPNKEDYQRFSRWCQSSHGIIVVAGKWGSGKTTLVYCAIQELIKQKRAIFSLENPVEFVIEGINQVEVEFSHQNKVYEAYDAIYDSDPDVLCLGLGNTGNDQQVISDMALRSAASGNLVIIQMEASSPIEALKKLEQSCSEKIKEYLIGISWQELIKHSSGIGRYARIETLEGPLAPKV